MDIMKDKNTLVQMQKAGFDVKSLAKQLQDFYLRVNEDHTQKFLVNGENEMEKAKKIVFHLNCLEHGGAERVVSNLANQFGQEGYEVIVATEWQGKR